MPADRAVAASAPAVAAGAGAAATQAPGRRAEQFAAILAASVVAVGVLWLDWSAFFVLALYWMENAVIGVANVMRLLSVGFAPTPAEDGAAIGPAPRIAHAIASIAIVPFFCLHYGLFCLVHGVFVVHLFAGDQDAIDGLLDAPIYMVFRVLGEPWGWLALAAIVAAVGVDTVRWFAGRRTASAGDNRYTFQGVMTAPYGRVVVLHVVLIIGSFLVLATKAPQAAVLLLAALKLAHDLWRAQRT